MIDPKELRIGNWVKIRGQFIVQVLDHITLTWFAYSQHQACGYSDTEPIPLTPEILERCRFESRGGFYYVHANINHYFEIAPNIRGFKLSVNGNEYEMGEVFLSLHQLQNIYFALTGEELIYTP